MNKINLRYLFLYVLMAVFIAPAVANITRTFGVQPAELTQSQILYSDSIDYLLGGSLLLKNGQTDKYLFDGGYVRSNATTGNFSFFYYNKDHLGNNREVLDHRGAVRQVTSYYPFGAPYADDAAISGTGIQPYKYNGKELDLMHGLNTYDYGARQYYSILGRWDRVDPLCERYYSTSPYVYCENDPVNAIDPDGRFGFKVLAKAAYKVGKTVAKNGLSSLTKSATYAAAFNDVVEDANTVFDSNASTGDRVVAGLSLLSEVIGPVSYKETKDIGKAINKVVHGNSKLSTKAQHAYDIINKETGKIVKTGVSGGRILRNGKSARAETQVYKWNKDVGKDLYESRITHEEPAGEGARAKILEYEKNRANKYRDELDPEKHKRP